MNSIKTLRFTLVELFVGATVAGNGAQVPFNDQPLLRTQQGQKVYIQAIETFSDQAFAQTASGNLVAPAAQIQNALLTLSVNNFFQIKQVPLARINNIWGDPANFVPFTENIMVFDNLTDVIWTESYLEFGQSPAGAVPFSFLFGVHYSLQPVVNPFF